MTDYIPTIEELNGKPERELNAIFRKAAEAADNTSVSCDQRTAASKTCELVRRVRCTMWRP